MSDPNVIPTTINETQRKVWQAAIAIQDGDPDCPVSLPDLTRRTGLNRHCVRSAVRRLNENGVGFPFPMERGRNVSSAYRKHRRRIQEASLGGVQGSCASPKAKELDLRRIVRKYIKEWKMIRRASAGSVSP